MLRGKNNFTDFSKYKKQNEDVSRNPHKYLGIQPNATQDEIQKAYRKVALQCHPDRTQNLSEQEREILEEKFKKAAEAYAILKK